MERRTILLIAAVAIAMLVAGGAAVAVTSTLRGGAINQVSAVRGEDASAFNNSTMFTDIPGASTTISVPRGERGLILARYSAETICHIVEGTTNTGDNKCSVRIMFVNNATGAELEAYPCGQFANFAFDKRRPSLHRRATPCTRSVEVGRGTYSVKAQWAVTHGDVRFRVDDWSLTVEKARVAA